MEEKRHEEVCSASFVSTHDVFLSFRGEDTRTNFTDYLYTALHQAGIQTFLDEEGLERGEEVGPSLLTAIEKSRISIPVFSRDYGSSKWCLDELAMMVDCRKTKRQTILPIFFHVNPSDVRNQRGTFEQAFRDHEAKFDKQRVERWKQALRETGTLKGWHVQDNVYEAKLIQIVVKTVLQKLDKTPLDVAKHPIGIVSRVEDMMGLLNVESEAVRFVGICGMGGIGKTTIAKALYNQILTDFDGGSFLADVREASQQHNGLVSLQKQLVFDILKHENQSINNTSKGINVIKERLCNKKVLVILDDVNQNQQLNVLAGGHSWFGSGSRIIITTRDEHVLNVNRVDETYEPKELDFHQSLQLFSKHAFGRDKPLDNYLELSKNVVLNAGGLPLALEVLGSFLFDKKKPTEWENTLAKLEKIPHKEVQKHLKISYDGLNDEEQEIFLDIACFFIGMDKEIAMNIWEDYLRIGMNVLVHRSLVKVDDKNQLRMHDQLRDMGREIVRQESRKEPGERSRLWSHEEVLDVLKKQKGTKKVEGLLIDFEENKETGSEEGRLSIEEVASMSKLRLLRINNAHLVGNFKHLSPELRWLHWQGCPLKFLPTNFHLEKLAVLDLSRSKITQVWNGWHQKKLAEKLEVLNLSHCYFLTRTPDFSRHPSLERLVLDHCVKLDGVDKSIEHLKKLALLNLKDCESLLDLPSSVCMLRSLEILILSGCSKLNNLPGNLGALESLTELLVDNTAIEQLPNSVGQLRNLRRLSLNQCRSLRRLPNSLGKMESLEELNLGATAIQEIPGSIGSLKKLEILSARSCSLLTLLPDSIGDLESLLDLLLDGTGIPELPNSIGLLAKLRRLWLHGCRSLSKIPDSVGRIGSLIELTLDGTLITEIPDFNGLQHRLERLEIRQCQLFSKLPDSISSLRNLAILNIVGTNLTELPDALGLLEKLEKLNVGKCKKLVKLPVSIGNLKHLRHFNLEETGIVELPEDFGKLSSLMELKMANCPNFKGFPDNFGSLTQLRTLHVQGNSQLTVLPVSFSGLCSLKELKATHCNLSEGAIPIDFGRLSSLEKLELGYNNFCSLPASISGLSLLKKLSLPHCTKLQSLPELPSGLTELDATNCASLERLSDLSNLKILWELRLTNCVKLTEIKGLERLKSLISLYMNGCNIQANGWRWNLVQGTFEHLRNFSAPGSEIPDWFTHKKLSCKVPKLSKQNLKINGVILCVIFALKELVQMDWENSLTVIPDIQAVITRNNRDIFTTALRIQGVPRNHKDHIYLCHFHERDGFVLMLKDSDQICISKRSRELIPGIQLKKGGIHMICKSKNGFESEDEQPIQERLADFFRSSNVDGGSSSVSTVAKETRRSAFQVRTPYIICAGCVPIAVLLFLYFLCRNGSYKTCLYIWQP